MTGLDTNILIQLAIDDHPAHRATAAAVQKELTSGSRLAFPSIVITEFLHVVTDKRRFLPPMTMAHAINWTESLLQNPTVTLLESGPASLIQTLLWMRQFDLGRKRIIDTHLAAILYTSRATRLLTSNPGDFEIFGVFDIVTPSGAPQPTSSPPAP
jgi:toxin-antitoxin system PIN domain toxin